MLHVLIFETEEINKPMKDSLQTALINEIIESKLYVTVYLTNGVQLRGTILNHDETVIVLEEEHRCKIIYKHALSTIVPFRPLEALNK